MVPRAVNQLSIDGLFLREFKTVKDASLQTKTNMGDISTCCRGYKKSANGFKWEYCNKYIKLKTDPLDKLLFIDDDDDDDI